MPDQPSLLRRQFRKLPPPLKVVLHMPRHYLTRLAMWRTVSREVRAVDGDRGGPLARSMRRAPLTALRELHRWRPPVMLEDAVLEAEGYGRFHVRANTDDLMHVIPSHQLSVGRTISSLLRPGDVFVDAGANIGKYTVLGGRAVGPEGRVIAVEMMADTAAQLQANLALNGLRNVRVVQRALDEAEGREITASTPLNGAAGQASVLPREGAGFRQETVVGTTLDALLADEPSIRLMKIDIEGAERQALRGGVATLKKLDAVIFESLGDAFSIAPLLEAEGFRISPLDRKNFVARRPGVG